MAVRQFVMTPAMGKRLIARGVAARPDVQESLAKGTLAIIAGTTNGYVAEEILKATGQLEGFTREGFRRGVVTPPGFAGKSAKLTGDVILVDGIWQKGAFIFDVADELGRGDVILKGANALDPAGRCGLLIGDPQAGTAGAAIRAVYGRRAKMIIPVGLEKRVFAPVEVLADLLNDPESDGPRMMTLPGEAFTEIDAIELLTDASAWLVSGGGIHGAEGALWVAVEGEGEDLDAAGELIASVAGEPPCEA